MNSAPQFGRHRRGGGPNGWVCSSAGEHRLHTAGVTGSIPVTPTIQTNPWRRPAAGGFAFRRALAGSKRNSHRQRDRGLTEGTRPCRVPEGGRGRQPVHGLSRQPAGPNSRRRQSAVRLARHRRERLGENRSAAARSRWRSLVCWALSNEQIRGRRIESSG